MPSVLKGGLSFSPLGYFYASYCAAKPTGELWVIVGFPAPLEQAAK